MGAGHSESTAVVFELPGPGGATTPQTWEIAPELAFMLLLGGGACLALGMTAHAVRWTVPAGMVLLAAGVFFLSAVEASGRAAVLLALGGLCVGLELFALVGFGLYAAGAATCVLLAGLSVSGSPEVHPALAVPASVGFGVATMVAALTSWRRRRDHPFDTTPRLVGRGAVVLAGTGSGTDPVAVVGGQVWRLEAALAGGPELGEGQFIRVVQARKDRLVVRAERGLARGPF